MLGCRWQQQPCLRRRGKNGRVARDRGRGVIKRVIPPFSIYSTLCRRRRSTLEFRREQNGRSRHRRTFANELDDGGTERPTDRQKTERRRTYGETARVYEATRGKRIPFEKRFDNRFADVTKPQNKWSLLP